MHAIAGQQVRLLVDTGSTDLVMFKTRLPAALSDGRRRGEKTVRPHQLERCDSAVAGEGVASAHQLHFRRGMTIRPRRTSPFCEDHRAMYARYPG
jgi:hypothetical protein